MDYENNRFKNFVDLSKEMDMDGNRKYSDKLLESLKAGDFNCLNEISVTDRNNKTYMEPLLYAVRNSEFGTYEVYKYYGEELQKKDLNMATEIVMNETEVLENTAITDNSTLVIYFAKIKPEIILYMSEELKSNGQFIEELCETGNKEAISYAVKECNISEVLQDNPDLANNPVFMKEAIKDDPSILLQANEFLKNDYTFIHEACSENKEVIDCIAEHAQEFGKEGLGAAKEVLVEQTTVKAIDEMKEELAKLQGENNNSQETEVNNEDEEKKKAIKERQLKNNIRFIEKIKNGEINQERAIRLINLICKNLDEEYKEELMKYIKMDDAIIEKNKEEKANKVELTDIEKVTNNARLPEVKKEEEETQKGIENPEHIIESTEGFTDDID